MRMYKEILKKAVFLCGIFLALCALPRTVLASSALDSYKDGKVYDVTAYGADNTGKKSCTTAVQEAVSASRKDLEGNNLGGKKRAVIYFPSGTYKLSVGFKINSNTVIAAESDTVIQASGTAVDIIRRENIVVDGGTWRSSGSSYIIKSTLSGIEIQNVTISRGSTGFLLTGGDITVKDCSISGCTAVGLQNSRGDLTLKNVTVSDCGKGFAFYSATSTVSSVSISGCSEAGIQNTRGTLKISKAKISGCKIGIILNTVESTLNDVTVSKCTDVGIQNTKGSMTLENSTVSGGKIGVGFYNSTVKFTGSSVSGCSDTAIQNTKSTLTLDKIKVSKSKTGIGVFQSTVKMNKVTVTGCTGLGMNVANKTKVTAKKVTVTDNGSGYPKKDYLGHGIGVYSDAVFTVSNSTISSNRECGISLSGGNAVVKNCTLENNGRHAVGTDKVCSLTMTGCTVKKNGLKDNHDGICIVAGSKATFTDCTIVSNACTGLLVTDGGTNVTVKNCTFKGNKAQNIYVENLGSGQAKVTIDGGKFYKSGSDYCIRVHVNSTSQYSLTLKGSIKYYKVKKGYTLWMGESMVHKTA